MEHHSRRPRGRFGHTLSWSLHAGLLGGCLLEVWVGDRGFIPTLGLAMFALVVEGCTLPLLLPLVHDTSSTAAVVAVLNAGLLSVRVRAGNGALVDARV